MPTWFHFNGFRRALRACFKTGSKRNSQLLWVIILSCWTANAGAGTSLDFWHSYTPPETGQKHYSFHLVNYKRGLFFGSCGLATRSQQWAFQFDLGGEGLRYGPEQISLSNEDGKQIHIVSGQISIDPKQTRALIALEIEQAGATNHFGGNGNYPIKKLK